MRKIALYRAAFAPLLVGLGAACGVAVAQFASRSASKGADRVPAAATEIPAEAQELLARIGFQFANTEGIYFEADVVVEMAKDIGGGIAVGQPIHGRFEYAASGNRWRRTSYLDPAGYPGLNTVVAYDGTMYQYFMPNAELLSVSLQGPDSRAAGMSLPNPILSLGRVLGHPRPDALNFTLAECRDRAALGGPEIVSAAKLEGTEGAIWQLVLTDPFSLEHGLANDQPMILVELAERHGWMPSVIRLQEGSQTVVRYEFEEYRVSPHATLGATSWPTRVTISSFDPLDGAIGGSMAFDITNLRIGVNAGQEDAFTLDWDGARRVWIEEARGFVK